jgi:hypothetical protein
LKDKRQKGKDKSKSSNFPFEGGRGMLKYNETIYAV